MVTNAVGSNGLVTKPLSEILSDLTAAFQSIYGADINVAQNSPDGQLIGIFAQEIADLLDLITQVYNSFDPDVAVGSALDARVALNGIQRIGGTYTITPVTITVDRALTLYGLDQNTQPVFTVSDGAGNKFDLITTHAFGGAGSAALSFQAETLGAVLTQLNTITTQVTVVVGVTAVNNPSAPSVLGVNQESDLDLRLRRQVSLAIGSTNSVDAMRSNLLNTASVTDAYVYDNFTSSNDTTFPGLTIPSHTMWAIVENGTNANVAATMYAKLGYGGMFLSGTNNVTQAVTTPTGDSFNIKFNRPIYTAIKVKFTLTGNERKAGATFDGPTVKAALATALQYRLFQEATSQDVSEALSLIVPLFSPTLILLSKDGGANYYEIISPVDPQHKFTLQASDVIIT